MIFTLLLKRFIRIKADIFIVYAGLFPQLNGLEALSHSKGLPNLYPVFVRKNTIYIPNTTYYVSCFTVKIGVNLLVCLVIRNLLGSFERSHPTEMHTYTFALVHVHLDIYLNYHKLFYTYIGTHMSICI